MSEKLPTETVLHQKENKQMLKSCPCCGNNYNVLEGFYSPCCSEAAILTKQEKQEVEVALAQESVTSIQTQSVTNRENTHHEAEFKIPETREERQRLLDTLVHEMWKTGPVEVTSPIYQHHPNLSPAGNPVDGETQRHKFFRSSEYAYGWWLASINFTWGKAEKEILSRFPSDTDFNPTGTEYEKGYNDWCKSHNYYPGCDPISKRPE